MKKIMLLSMIILLLPIAYSIYGGETWVYHFDECDELRANITAVAIDEGEYEILNDCIENNTNYWVCDCENDFDFKIKFKVNTLNNYTIYFNYDYSKMITETSGSTGGSSSSGGGGGFYNSSYWKDKFANKTVTIEELEEIIEEIKEDEEIPPGVIEELEEIIEEAKVVEEEKKSTSIYWIIGIGIIVIIGGVIVFLYFKD